MPRPEPPLPLARSPLDPATDHRKDPDWLERAWADPTSRVAVFHADRVGLSNPAEVNSAWRLPEGIREAAVVWVFLGLDEGGAARFAAAVPEPAEALVDAAAWHTLRDLAMTGQLDELAMLTPAVALLNWHASHTHCPRCGTPTEPAQAGWVRTCPADGTDHFPRVDPAVIMLPLDSHDRALFGRQQRWPEKWYSTLAGFVEPGEALETAVGREIAEEVGLTVIEAQYLRSQPWPFPSSLMLGFHARVEDAEPVPDGEEIAEAMWLTREQLVVACTSGEVRLPPRMSISRWLVERWFGDQLPGDWSRR